MAGFKFNVIVTTEQLADKPVNFEADVTKLLQNAGYDVGEVEAEGV